MVINHLLNGMILQVPITQLLPCRIYEASSSMMFRRTLISQLSSNTKHFLNRVVDLALNQSQPLETNIKYLDPQVPSVADCFRKCIEDKSATLLNKTNFLGANSSFVNYYTKPEKLRARLHPEIWKAWKDETYPP